MTPSELRRTTAATMRQALLAMMSPQWDLALRGRPKAEVTEAAEALLGLQRARLRLVNARLADIRDRLAAGEPELVRAARRMDRALEKLNNVRNVIAAATALLKVAGRIVGLA